VGGFDRRSVALERSAKKRSPSSRFADLGDRLAKTFAAPDRTRSSWPSNGDPEGPTGPDCPDEPGSWDQARFPITRQGYDCAAVDEHVAELEQELAELDQELAQLRASTPAEGEVAAEIQRIGEQTSTILLTAHDRARETTRQAQEQADRCLADAAASAIALTKEANRKLHDLESEKLSVWRERARMLEDVESVARALSTLAMEAGERFPGELEKMTALTAAAAESTEHNGAQP
jgi:cell division septum initiation protein DivIVA